MGYIYTIIYMFVYNQYEHGHIEKPFFCLIQSINIIQYIVYTFMLQHIYIVCRFLPFLSDSSPFNFTLILYHHR